MKANEILNLFFKEASSKTRKNGFFIIEGVGGVGKSYLLEELQVKLNDDNFLNIFISTDDSPDKGSVIANISTQLLNKGYHGKYISVLEKFIAEQRNLLGIVDDPSNADNDFTELPLFESIYSTPRNNYSYQYSPEFEINTISSILEDLCINNKLFLFADFSINNPEIEKYFKELIDRVNIPVLVVIACRSELPILWPYKSERAIFTSLDPLDQNETKNFLQHIGDIDDVSVITVIHELTGGYPQFLSQTINFWKQKQRKTYRIFSSKHFRQYISNSIITCQFREIKNPELISFVKYASTCRSISKEALQKIVPKNKVETLYEEFIRCSFVVPMNHGFIMLPILQRSLLEEWRSVSPEELEKLHRKLLGYYNKLHGKFLLEEKNIIESEIIYHNLSIDEKKSLGLLRQRFFELEERYDINHFRLLINNISNFPFTNQNIEEWSIYWNASLDRLTYNWENAESLYRHLHDRTSSYLIKGYCYYGLGQVLRLKGDWDNAYETLRIAHKILNSSRDKNLRFITLSLKGTILARKHLWSDALKINFEALEFAEKQSNDYLIFIANLAIGKLYRSQGNWRLAEDYLNHGLDIANKINNKNYEAITHYEIAKLGRAKGDFNIAEDNLFKCLDLRKELGDYLGEAICLNSLGNVMLHQKKFEEARDYFLNSIKIKETISDNFGLAKSYNGLGHIKQLNEDYINALKEYKKALSFYEITKNKTKIRRLLCRIGMTLASQGKWEESTEYLEQSKIISTNERDRQGISEIFFELGRIQEKQGNMNNSMDAFELSAKHARESLSIAREIPPIVALARTNYYLKRNQSAMQAAQEVRLLAARYGRFKDITVEYTKWGNYDFNKREFDVSFFCFAEALNAAVEGNIDIDKICGLLNKNLSEIITQCKIDDANRISELIIKQWEVLSDTGNQLRKIIAIELHKSDTRERDYKLLQNISNNLTIIE